MKIDHSSLTWVAVRDYVEKAILELRSENDADLDPVATAMIRGGIKRLNQLLEDIGEEKKVDRPQSESYIDD